MVIYKIKPYADYIEYIPLGVILAMFIVSMDHMKFHIKKACFNSIILIITMLVLYGLLMIDSIGKEMAILIATVLFLLLIYLKRCVHKKPEAL